jgi:hypothetical protein
MLHLLTTGYGTQRKCGDVRDHGEVLEAKRTTLATREVVADRTVSEWIAIVIYIAVALFWLVPDRRIETVSK